MKALATVLLVTIGITAAASANDTRCLRGDAITSLKMTPAANRAEAIDRQGRRFGITFVAPCDARHQNVFFVVKPESMPLCVGQGTAFATSGDGVCVVKAVGRPG